MLSIFKMAYLLQLNITLPVQMFSTVLYTVCDCWLQAAISGELQGVAHMVQDSTGLTGRAIEVGDSSNSPLNHVVGSFASSLNSYTTLP